MTEAQTATVSDAAVEAAVKGIQKVSLTGELISDEELAIAALTAALPHLALSSAPCSVEVWNDAVEQSAVIADSCYLLTPDVGNAVRNLKKRALSPAEPAQGEQWQDIATAPKDGEPILIWKPDERRVGEYLMSAYWSDDLDGFVPVGGIHKQGYYSESTQCNQGYPTHWMPLPAAPTLSDGRTTEGGEV